MSVLTSQLTSLIGADVTSDLRVGPITMHLQLLMEVVPPEQAEWEGTEPSTENSRP